MAAWLRAGLGAALLAVALWAAGGMLAPAHAEVRALLVGVSGYPGLPAARRLNGPRHDVQRMQQVLRRRGVAAERIELLADGVAGAGQPTRHHILDGLARLASQAQHGDTVVLMFAGHGSRQPPARSGEPPETVFLPLDAAGWNERQQQIGNAITSSELRAAVDRIGARGAFVWVVFDACHSARLVRSGEDAELQWRHVPPQELGVPAGALAASGSRPAEVAPPGGAAQGAYFYAAQAHEVTPEMPLPKGVTGARVHGLFSHVLMTALERAGAITYRQLAQQVLASYGVLDDALATPLFSGNGLDAPLLGGRAAPVQQWALERDGAAYVLPAGALAGISPGAVLAVLPDALAGNAQALGHLRVDTLLAERATLLPVAHGGRPAPAATTLRAGQLLRLVHNPPALGLRVAWRRQGCAAGCALAEAVAQLQRNGVPGVALQWADSAGAAELLLVQQRDHITLRSPGSDTELARLALRAPGVNPNPAPDKAPDTGELAARLAVRLHTVARARNLLRVAERLLTDGAASELQVTLQHQRAGATAAQALTSTAVAALRSGDRLQLTVHNRGTRAHDLTVLYLDADHGVGTLFPSAMGETNRIEPGARQVIDGILISAPPVGLERLLLISLPSRSGSETRDYSFLQQPPLARVRGGSEEPDLFDDAAFASHLSRGAAVPAAAAAGLVVQLYTVNVQR
jgi:Caspase domain